MKGVIFLQKEGYIISIKKNRREKKEESNRQEDTAAFITGAVINLSNQTNEWTCTACPESQ